MPPVCCTHQPGSFDTSATCCYCTQARHPTNGGCQLAQAVTRANKRKRPACSYCRTYHQRSTVRPLPQFHLGIIVSSPYVHFHSRVSLPTPDQNFHVILTSLLKLQLLLLYIKNRPLKNTPARLPSFWAFLINPTDGGQNVACVLIHSFMTMQPHTHPSSQKTPEK